MAPDDKLPETLRHAPFTAFDVWQLRNLIFAHTKSPENIPRSRAELLRSLEVIRDDAMDKLVARLELTQAYKHAFLYRISETASKKVSAALLEKWLLQNKEAKVGATNLYPLDFHAGDYLSLRFVQPVLNHVFEQVSETTIEIRPKRVRHTVVVALKPSLGIIEVRFDGFEQTKHTPSEFRLDYMTIANDCRAVVQTILDEPVEGLPLRASIEEMLKKHKDEVVQFGIKSRFKHGTISIDSDESADGDLTSYIAEAFPGIDPTKAVSPWTNKNVMLKWHHLKIATRIDLAGETSEILFLWRRGSSKTLASTDHIIKKLVENSATWSGDARQRLEGAFEQRATWGTLTPQDIAQASNVTMPEALEFLLEQTVSQRAEIRYRFNTREALHETDNPWTESLASLPPFVTSVSGITLDASNPKHIEVGFQVVGGTK